MAIPVTCTGCDEVYSVGENLLGKTIKCKACGEMMVVSAPKAKASRPADDAAPARKPARRPADDEDDDYEDDGRSVKKKGPPVALLAGIGAVLLIGGGAAGYYAMSGGGDNGGGQQVAANTNNTPPAGGAADETQPAVVTKPPVKKPSNTKPAEAKADETKPAESKPAKADEKPVDEKPQPVAARPADAPRAADGSGSSLSMSLSDFMSGRMPPFTREKVKKAAVMFRVEVEGGTAEGSGWFGVEPGLVFTNAHVIAMKSPTAKPPKKITLFLNTGTDEQRTIENARVKILAVDWDLDLAILKVENEPDLPTPLQIRPSAGLQEQQGLTTIGYPFGTGGGISGKPPPVAIRPTTFSRPLKDVLGRTRRIQIEGGVYTGNSGGAIVDAEGYVVGVVVEVRLDNLGGGQTQLGLGVPTEYVLGLANGRVAEVEYGVPYKDAGKVKIPVKAKCLDPFGRLKQVGLGVWVGDAPPKEKDRIPFRKESKDPPKMGAADGDYTELALKYDPKTKLATGEVTMPEPPAGRVYWAQPYYANQEIPKYYLPGAPVATDGPAVDRVPANLTFRVRDGAVRTVTMSNSSSGLAELNEDESGRGVNLKTTLTVRETMLPADKSDSLQAARLRMQIEDLKLSADVAGRGEIEEVIPKRIAEQLNELFKQVEAIGAVNRSGEMYKYLLRLLAIPDPQAKFLVEQLGGQSIDALQATSIPLPNREVKPGESWSSVKDVRLTLIQRVAPARPAPGAAGTPPPAQKLREYKYRDEVKFTYVGTRERGGRKEAVVQIEGKLAQAPGERATVSGEIKGLALIELDTGLVTKADITKVLDMDTSSDGKKKRVSANNHYTLTRGSAN